MLIPDPVSVPTETYKYWCSYGEKTVLLLCSHCPWDLVLLEFRKLLLAGAVLPLLRVVLPGCFHVSLSWFLHGQGSSCSGADVELKPSLGQGFDGIIAWKSLGLGSWLFWPSKGSFLKISPALPASPALFCSTWCWLLLEPCILKIPSQTIFMENFGSVFAFDPFTSIGQSYWEVKKKLWICRGFSRGYFGD